MKFLLVVLPICSGVLDCFGWKHEVVVQRRLNVLWHQTAEFPDRRRQQSKGGWEKSRKKVTTNMLWVQFCCLSEGWHEACHFLKTHLLDILLIDNKINFQTQYFLFTCWMCWWNPFFWLFDLFVSTTSKCKATSIQFLACKGWLICKGNPVCVGVFPRTTM